jgi:hypothetical protein
MRHAHQLAPSQALAIYRKNVSLKAHGVLAMLHAHGIPPDTTDVCIILSPDMSVHTAVE